MQGELKLSLGLPPQAEIQFGEFYRTRLRPVIGKRLKSRLLRDSYLQWAAETGCGSLSYNEICRYMAARGHRHLVSNGVAYLDVSLLDAGEALHAQVAMRIEAEARGISLVAQIDLMIDKMVELRHPVAACRTGLGIAENTVLVGIEGHRLAVPLHIFAGRLHIGEGIFTLDHLELHQLTGRVVNVNQQGALRPAIFKPTMF